MELLGQNIDLAALKDWKVVDKDNKSVGRIIDFAMSKDYKLTKFILGGSLFEEFIERIGIKTDDDPVISLENISGLDKSKKVLKLDISSNDLPSKLHENAFTKDEMVFSKISKTKVYCKDNTHIGNVVDAIFSEENDVSLILGENSVVEFLERVGLTGNYDLLVPSKYVEKQDETGFYISKSKSDLVVLLDNEEVPEETVNYERLKKEQIRQEILKYKGTHGLGNIR